MDDYEIFREQLAIKHPSYGYALWVPGPRNPAMPVQVGDVGFTRRGKFHRLFNALLPVDDPSHEFGLPEYHEPLVPSVLNHLDADFLARNNYCSAGVSVEPDPGYNYGPDDFPQVLFRYQRTRGAAVLSLPVPARREDTLARGDFGRWMVRHIDTWFDFARNLGLGIEQMEEIILVTGCDRTRSWTNVAFLGSQADAQVSFGVKVEGEGPNASINFQFSPENARGAVLRHGPEGPNLPENQCVFFRGFRVVRSFWILPRRLKAAAGSSSDPEGHVHDPDMEVVSMPAITKYRDPLHLLLDYIAEQASDCEMVLAHDDDLMTIDGLGHDTPLETLEPDAMMDLLRRSNIEIHKVSCDLSPTDSGPNADTSAVSVAVLSITLQNWNIESQSQSSPLAASSQDIDLGSTSEPRRVSQMDHAKNSPHTQNLLAPQPQLTRDYLTDGYISYTFNPRNAESYLVQLFNVRGVADIQAICYQNSAFYVLNQPPRNCLPPHSVYGRDAWLLDYTVLRSGGSVVPQQLWLPHSQGDRRRYVEQAQLRMPVFFVNANGNLGVPVMSAALGDVRLRGALPPQLADKTTIKIRMAWPGYGPSEHQVRLRDQTALANPINFERFVKFVGSRVKQFLLDCERIPVLPSNWRVGSGNITSDEVMLIGIVHVSEGSWMPILQLTRRVIT